MIDRSTVLQGRDRISSTLFGVDDPHPRGQIIKEAPKTEIEKTGNLQSLSKKGPGRPAGYNRDRESDTELSKGREREEKKLSLFSPPPRTRRHINDDG